MSERGPGGAEWEMKPKRKGWKAVPGLRRVLDAQPGKLEFILRAKGLVGEPPSEPAVQVTCGGGGGK